MSHEKRKEWVYVGLPAEIVNLIDQVIAAKKWGFRSRNEFVLEAVKMRLKQLGYYP
ncbi:MAG: CopG family transcriptional regulator [Candidatus Bathyarchaeia archaeon]